jgi:hypothetical protein
MARRVGMLVLTIALVFAVTVAILLRVLPGPRSDADYLVAGAVATFAALLALFIILINGWVKTPDVFFKRRDRLEPPAPPPPEKL